MMDAHPEKVCGARVSVLDAIRGIAALIVVFDHAYLIVPEHIRYAISVFDIHAWLAPWAWLRFSPLRLLVDGEASVMVFFVLSGFVLVLPFLRGSQPTYERYLTKRFCRIYLPFAAAILFAAGAYIATQPVAIPALSDWFNSECWEYPLSVNGLLGHLAMIGRPPDYDLDVPTWSLAHEMRISIIFPPLVFAVFRLGALRALAMALALHIACMCLRFVSDTTPFGTVLMTGSFVLLFVFGITLATHADIWQARLVGLSAGTRAVLWVASFAALIYPTFASDVPLIFGLGGLGIIALSLTSPRAQHLLSADPIMWLGRVSYSLYLVHLIVLEAAAHLLFGLVPPSVILLGAILVSLVCAHVAYHLIERPAIKLGQRLARREMRRAVILN